MLQFRNQFLAFYRRDPSENYTGRRFADISEQMKVNAVILAGFLVVHLLFYVFHALLTVPAFRRAKVQRNVFNMLTSSLLFRSGTPRKSTTTRSKPRNGS